MRVAGAGMVGLWLMMGSAVAADILEEVQHLSKPMHKKLEAIFQETQQELRERPDDPQPPAQQ